MKNGKYGKMFCFTLFVFESFLPLIGAQTRSTPIDVNLIIDSSESLPGVKEEITTWISNNFVDQILAEGDNFAVWSAGSKAKVIFSGTIKGNSAKEDVKKSIHEIASAGKTADFSSALKEAALRCQNSPFSYTLLISASPASLEQVLSGGHASLMRYSKVEEFSGWRALVVGLNLDEKVGRAAAAYIGS